MCFFFRIRLRRFLINDPMAGLRVVAGQDPWRTRRGRRAPRSYPGRMSKERAIELDLMHRTARTPAGRTMQAARLARQNTAIAMARAQIPKLLEAELFVAGVALYWAEGTKAKPWRRGEQVTFINSDASVIQLFLAWRAQLPWSPRSGMV